MVLTYLIGSDMKVYVLMASTSATDNAYCQWEWSCHGVYATEAAAEAEGELYLKRYPDEEFYVLDLPIEGL